MFGLYLFKTNLIDIRANTSDCSSVMTVYIELVLTQWDVKINYETKRVTYYYY